MKFVTVSVCCIAAIASVVVQTTIARAAVQTSDVFDSISYTDSGGFAGGGTGKSLTIFSDGRGRTVSAKGLPVAFQLQPPDLAALRTATGAVDWPHVAHAYVHPGAADLVVRNLVISVRGTKYETHADALAKLPQPLRTVFDELDDLWSRVAKPGK